MKRFITISLVALALAGSGAVGAQQATRRFVPVTDAMLQKPDPSDWLMWRRTLDGWGFSPLTQINRNNVAQLRMVWAHGLGPGKVGQPGASEPARELAQRLHDAGELLAAAQGQGDGFAEADEAFVGHQPDQRHLAPLEAASGRDVRRGEGKREGHELDIGDLHGYPPAGACRTTSSPSARLSTATALPSASWVGPRRGVDPRASASCAASATPPGATVTTRPAARGPGAAAG